MALRFEICDIPEEDPQIDHSALVCYYVVLREDRYSLRELFLGITVFCIVYSECTCFWKKSAYVCHSYDSISAQDSSVVQLCSMFSTFAPFLIGRNLFIVRYSISLFVPLQILPK